MGQQDKPNLTVFQVEPIYFTEPSTHKTSAQLTISLAFTQHKYYKSNS